MDRPTLHYYLRREVDRWSAKSFDTLRTELVDVVAYTIDEQDSAQVEVVVLERNDEYVHVGVAVDDGRWTAFAPVTTSFLVHRDGRIEKPLL